MKRLALCIAVTIAAPELLLADGWFGGIEAGRVDHSFSPDYTFVDGSRPNSRFVNETDGFEIGLVGGYTKSLDERVGVDGLVRAGWNDAEWTLYLPSEPAWFKYSIEYSLGASIRPHMEIISGVGLFLEAGLQMSYIEESKASPSADRTSYDASEWILGYTLGLGISASVNEDISVALLYREVEFNTLNYNAHLPDGTLVNTIKDDPTAESISLALTYTF